ncbi:MAG: WecB/TagA/CpsF family glycosyltransferase, partial [Bacilli bacterium]
INGYTEDKDAVFEEIKKKNSDIVLVALGVPKQEKLIFEHLSKFDKGIFIGIGGSLDVISGSKKRAPKLFIKMNLEWLYRILREPKRIKRFYESNVKFIFRLRNEIKGEKQND